MKIRMMACVAAALLGAAPVAAQQGGGSATSAIERLAERSPVRDLLRDAGALGLTRDQTRALEAIERERAARADSAVAALRAAEAGGVGEAGPGRRIGAASAALRRAEAEARQRAWAILTPEQRARFHALAEERGARGRAGGGR